MTPAPRGAIACLAACSLGTALGQTMVVPALPAIQVRVGGSADGVAAIMTWFLLVGAVSTPVAARLGRNLGERSVLVSLLGCYAVGSLVATVGVLHGSMTTIVAGRVLQGLSAGVIPLAFSIIRRIAPPERMAMNIVMMSSMLALGGAISLPLGGLMIDGMGVEWIFVVSLLAGLCSIVAVRVFLPSLEGAGWIRVDVRGAVLLGVGLTGLLLALADLPQHGWASWRTVPMLVVAIGVLVVWTRTELRTPEPLVDVRGLGDRVVLRANIVTFLIGFGTFGAFFLLPTLLQVPVSGGGLGLGATGAALMTMPVALVNFAVSPLLGLLGRWYGLRLPVVVGCGAGAVTLGLIAVAPTSLAALVVASLMWGVAFAGGMAAMSNLIVQSVPAAQTGEVVGMNIIIRNVGAAAGTQAAAAVIALAATWGAQPGHAVALAIAMAALVSVVATACAVLIPVSGPVTRLAG